MKFLSFRFISILVLSIMIGGYLNPYNVFATSTTFSPVTCPTDNDFVTHASNQVNNRVSGLTASDSTKKYF